VPAAQKGGSQLGILMNSHQSSPGCY
jgi:hypothetical protein